MAISLGMVVSGPAAAVPLKRDLPTDGATWVLPDPPQLHDPSWLDAKLRTKAGYRVLVYG